MVLADQLAQVRTDPYAALLDQIVFVFILSIAERVSDLSFLIVRLPTDTGQRTFKFCRV